MIEDILWKNNRADALKEKYQVILNKGAR